MALPVAMSTAPIAISTATSGMASAIPARPRISSAPSVEGKRRKPCPIAWPTVVDGPSASRTMASCAITPMNTAISERARPPMPIEVSVVGATTPATTSGSTSSASATETSSPPSCVKMRRDSSHACETETRAIMPRSPAFGGVMRGPAGLGNRLAARARDRHLPSHGVDRRRRMARERCARAL